MKTFTTITVAALLGLALAGCGGGNGGVGTPTSNSVKQIATATANSTPFVATNPALLANNIDAVFGSTAVDPVDVLPGETVGELITRLGG